MATVSIIVNSEPEDFTVEDAFIYDDITFSRVDKVTTATALLYPNTQNKIYDDIIKVTALQTGTFRLENAYRTSNNITACAIRFYDLQNGTAGYNWVEIQPAPTPLIPIELGTFNKNQIFILQMRISNGIDTNIDEQVKFDMKLIQPTVPVVISSVPIDAEINVNGIIYA